MKIYILFLTSFLILSCSKKNVELPIIGQKGIAKVYNNTKVWIFFKKKELDTIAILNKNNVISTTNWIFNIDKRLPLKKIVPLIQQMQKEHAKITIHSVDGVFNYYSYADTIGKHYSFIKFTTKFSIGKPQFEPSKNEKNIDLIFYKKKFTINNLSFNYPLLANKLDSISRDSITHTLNLAFQNNLDFQNYLTIKLFIEKIKNQFTNFNKKEIIFEY